MMTIDCSGCSNNIAVSGDFCTGNNINLALFTASGSMHSTTKDLLIWLQTLEKNLLLTKTSKAFLLNSENRAGWDSQTLVLADNKPRKVVIANGELEGNSALLVNLPEEHISMILLSNYGMTYSQIAAVALEIIYILLSDYFSCN